MNVKFVLDCADPVGLAKFWAEALHYEIRGSVGQYVVLTGDGPTIILQGVTEPKTVKNRMHLDINDVDIEAEAARLQALGATRLSEAMGDEGITEKWIVMADPEGNEFCVCGNP